MKNTYIPACGLIGLLLCGPLQAAAPVALTYDQMAVDGFRQNYPSACKINVLGISDQRNNKETIGADFVTVRSGDPLPWLAAGFDNLKAYGFTVGSNPAPQADAINIDVQLKRAYTWHGQMRINGVVALDLGIVGHDGQRTVEKLRASGSKNNWAGAHSDYVTTLNYAFNTVLHKAAYSLQQKCLAKTLMASQ